MFKRKKATHEVSFTDEGVSVRSDDQEFVAEIVVLWYQAYGTKAEPKEKQPMGFSNAHMSEVESDTERAEPAADIELDDEDED